MHYLGSLQERAFTSSRIVFVENEGNNNEYFYRNSLYIVNSIVLSVTQHEGRDTLT